MLVACNGFSLLPIPLPSLVRPKKWPSESHLCAGRCCSPLARRRVDTSPCGHELLVRRPASSRAETWPRASWHSRVQVGEQQRLRPSFEYKLDCRVERRCCWLARQKSRRTLEFAICARGARLIGQASAALPPRWPVRRLDERARARSLVCPVPSVRRAPSGANEAGKIDKKPTGTTRRYSLIEHLADRANGRHVPLTRRRCGNQFVAVLPATLPVSCAVLFVRAQKWPPKEPRRKMARA